MSAGGRGPCRCVSCTVAADSRRERRRRKDVNGDDFEGTRGRPFTHLAHLTHDGRGHALLDHLQSVAEEAARFAQPFGAEELAHLAGLWHDLGKYAPSFQQMIHQANGVEAHIEGDTDGPRDHSSAGAIHAARTLEFAGTPIAFAIAGHHAGRERSHPSAALLRIKANKHHADLILQDRARRLEASRDNRRTVLRIEIDALPRAETGQVFGVPRVRLPRSLWLQRAHTVVARIVLHLSQAQRFQERRQIHAKAASQTLLYAIPATDRIVGRAAPSLHCAGRSGLLFVSAA